MHILLSNDDGYQAPGLRCLQQRLQQFARVTVVAPDRDCSGMSHCLTLSHPLRVKQHDDGVFSVNGTPADCVHLATTALLTEPPDAVISGINAGHNLCDDVLYSGTVAAATEARYLGVPTFAISLVGESPTHYETAVEVAVNCLNHKKNTQQILNINVPDVPLEALAGYQVTRLGVRNRFEGVIAEQDPRGRPVYWIGRAGEVRDAGPGTDSHAVQNNYVSITPLQTNLTHTAELPAVQQWAQAL